MSTQHEEYRPGEFPAPRLELRNAVIQYRSQQLQYARLLYKQLRTVNQRHPAALRLCGRMFHDLGDDKRAIALMLELLRLQPRDAAAHCRLGRSYLRLGKSADAKASFRRCIELDPKRAAGWLGLGEVHERFDDYESAIQCYDEALAIRPRDAEARHRKGLCLRMTLRPKEALAQYRKARELGCEQAQLHCDTANALVDVLDIEGAIAAYGRALERNPLDAESHRSLNSLLWQQGRVDEYLGSYRRVLACCPTAQPLRLALATALARHGDAAGAERILREAPGAAPRSADFKNSLALCLEAQGRWEEASRLHAEAVITPGSVPDHRISYVRALLVCDRPREALQQAERAAAVMPFNQQALAYLGLCWRILGDERDDYLNDYDASVAVFDLPTPPGYSSIHEFNAQLAAVLNPMHIARRHPDGQTVRGGTQTLGDLFTSREPAIAELVSSLRLCLADYISGFPHDAGHPLFSRRSEGFDYSASWSVRMTRGGFHTMHVHPMGWISSVYYVQAPEEVPKFHACGGALEFGKPDIDIGEHGRVRRRVQPRAGRLVLFPSYLWHGTAPLEVDAPRMTVAFDVVPEN